ncbi:MAG TPA: hypothetical protein VHW66_20715 [Stellaceae bacterium]|nr:hypothetical protein [Stellaceae bacterium]
MGRYETGETLASIARTYDCSPPAISYIVSRSRDKQSAAEAAVPAVEPQLVKVHVAEPAVAMVDAVAEPSPPAPAFVERNAGLAATLARGISPRPNGMSHQAPQAAAPQPPIPPAPAAPTPAAPTNGDNRRTLHLSLDGSGSNGGGHANGNGGSPPQHNGNGNGNGFRQPAASPLPQMPAPPQPQDRFEQRPVSARYGFPPNGGERFNGGPSGGMDNNDAGRRNKDPGTFIDQELRARVDGDIAAFLAAFDASLAGDTLESRAGLREATDRLLRAGARTRIELERLEARVPLATPRDGDSRSEPNWRHR